MNFNQTTVFQCPIRTTRRTKLDSKNSDKLRNPKSLFQGACKKLDLDSMSLSRMKPVRKLGKYR